MQPYVVIRKLSGTENDAPSLLYVAIKNVNVEVDSGYCDVPV